MHVVSVVGPDGSGRRALVARLAECFAERGAVATVRAPDVGSTDGGTLAEPDTDDSTADQSSVEYRLTDDGVSVSGQRPSVWEILEDLAPDYEYAVFEGVQDDTIPTVALGDAVETDDSTEADEGNDGDDADDHLLAATSGSDVDADALVDVVEATEPFETLESLVARAKASPEAPKSGAIATFTGRVRAKEHDDDTPTEYLEFEQYDDVADDRFDEIRVDLEAREGVFEVIMHHRTGVIEYGKDIVFVVVLAGHRSEAFATVEDGINRLKAEVPIFKKEVTVDEEFWAHEGE